MSKSEPPQLLQTATAETIAKLRTIVARADHGALATLSPDDGAPLCTRVGLATLADGTPVIFVSALAAHTPALFADPRCSLLLGDVGRGDPLAHPRATLKCRAAPLAPDDPLRAEALTRYLATHPKAKLYAGLPDFIFFALHPVSVAFNGGFGKAYAIEGSAILDRA